MADYNKFDPSHKPPFSERKFEKPQKTDFLSTLMGPSIPRHERFEGEARHSVQKSKAEIKDILKAVKDGKNSHDDLNAKARQEFTEELKAAFERKTTTDEKEMGSIAKDLGKDYKHASRLPDRLAARGKRNIFQRVSNIFFGPKT